MLRKYSVNFCLVLDESEAVTEEELKQNIRETLDCHRGMDGQGEMFDIQIKKTFRKIPEDIESKFCLYD